MQLVADAARSLRGGAPPARPGSDGHRRRPRAQPQWLGVQRPAPEAGEGLRLCAGLGRRGGAPGSLHVRVNRSQVMGSRSGSMISIGSDRPRFAARLDQGSPLTSW